MTLNLEQKQAGLYDVFFYNGKKLGQFYMEVDGYYVFLPENNSGYFNEYSLKLIINKLTELNKEWDNHVKDNYL